MYPTDYQRVSVIVPVSFWWMSLIGATMQSWRKAHAHLDENGAAIERHAYVSFGALRIFGRAATSGAVSAISGLSRFAGRTILMGGLYWWSACASMIP